MNQFKLLLLLLFPLTVLSQNQDVDIELKLEGLREEVKSNGYNAKEIDYFSKENNLIYTITYDSNGNLEETPMGIAIVESRYDQKGNQIQQSYYDQNKKLFRTEFVGPAIVKYKYDKNNNKIETIYCDENGEPLDNGLAIVLFKYDNQGNVIEENFLNHKRKLTDGVCIYKFKIDQNGRKIEEIRYDSSKEIIRTGEKYESSITRYKYDEQDRIIETTYFNENNELIEGEAKVVYDYTHKPKSGENAINSIFGDKDPKWVEQIYFDKDGNMIRKTSRYLPKGK